MKNQLSAFSRQPSVRPVWDRAPSPGQGARSAPENRSRSRISKLWSLLALLAILMLTLGAGDTPGARFTDLGHRMMCTCGCNQVLLECNHVGCTVSDQMRAELKAAIDKGLNDDQVLDVFVQKYGATVLNAPSTKGFNLVAWIMPFAVLLVGTWAVVMFVRRWQSRLAPAGPPLENLPGADVDALRRQAREETEV